MNHDSSFLVIIVDYGLQNFLKQIWFGRRPCVVSAWLGWLDSKTISVIAISATVVDYSLYHVAKAIWLGRGHPLW